ncbi:MAG: carbohydrate-binding family 9-like protein [Oligosphaeraceae bacterium]
MRNLVPSLLLPVLGVALVFLSASCGHLSSPEEFSPVVARRVQGLVVDARQSDPAWEKAVPVTLSLYDPAMGCPEKTVEAVAKEENPVAVTARLLHDEKNLYVGCHIRNDDICCLTSEDQLLHFLLGDVMEVFLKPAQAYCYLELYATPSARKTTFFFPSRSWGGPEYLATQSLMPELGVVSAVDGTLNDSTDRDDGWWTVMTIPKEMVEKKTGVPLESGQIWQILLAGYARSSHRSFCVNFSYPLQPVLNFHHQEYWGALVLE